MVIFKLERVVGYQKITPVIVLPIKIKKHSRPILALRENHIYLLAIK